MTMEDGPEFSNRYYEPVLEDLQKSGATLHVLAIGTPSSSQDDEMRNRNIVIADGTSRTGGRREQVLALSAIPEVLKQLAAELNNQYVVTYARPEMLIPPQKVDVTVTQPGLTFAHRSVSPDGRTPCTFETRSPRGCSRPPSSRPLLPLLSKRRSVSAVASS